MAVKSNKVKVVLQRIKEEKQRSIEEGRTTYDTSSQKDEIDMMRAMLNDFSYVNGIYNNSECIGVTCPSVQLRKVLTDTICNVFNLERYEVEQELNKYNFTDKDAEQLISISKQFVVGYLESGRKLPFGQRRNCDISLTMKTVPAHKVFHPIKISKEDGGTETIIKETMVPKYDQLRTSCKCPAWKKYVERTDGITIEDPLHPDNSTKKYHDYPRGMDEKQYKDGKLIVMEFLK